MADIETTKPTTIEAQSEAVMKLSREILQTIEDFQEQPQPSKVEGGIKPPLLDALAQIAENLNQAEVCLRGIQGQFSRLKTRIRN